MSKPNDLGTCPNPRRVELTLYEDRHGAHVVKATADGKTETEKVDWEYSGERVPREERVSFAEPATLAAIRRVLAKLETACR